MIDLTGKDQSWWPKLKGQTVAILASGPSQSQEQCDAAIGAGWTCIAINETWRIARRAAILYGCDWQWWRARAPSAEEWKGQRITGTVPMRKHGPAFHKDMQWQCELLNYIPVMAGYSRIRWDGPTLGAGSNSAFQAVNLAVRCGAKRIILTGVDCRSPNAHWHEPHSHPMANVQRDSTIAAWIRAWKFAAVDFKERGIKCIDCSPKSALTCFQKMSIEEAVKNYDKSLKEQKQIVVEAEQVENVSDA